MPTRTKHRQPPNRMPQQAVPPVHVTPAPARRHHKLMVLLPILATIAIFTPISYIWAKTGDFGAHHEFAFMMILDQEQRIITPHCLYHILFLASWFAARFILPFVIPGLVEDSFAHWAMSVQPASTFTLLLFLVLQVIIVYYLLFNILLTQTSRVKAWIIASLLSVALMVASPLNFIFPLDGKHYFGYIVFTVFHNPTFIVLKPLGLLFFLLILKLLQAENRFNLRLMASAFALTVVSILAKPSYAICAVPVFGLYTIPMMIRGHWRLFTMIALGIFLPVALSLGWQYSLTYTGNAESKIIWAPLAAISAHSSWLLVKYLLSILFPAAVYLAFFSRARRDFALNLSWLIFLLGSFYTYFLAESGERFYHGNLGWGTLECLFILFVFSVIFLLKNRADIRQTPKMRFAYRTCWVLFFLHICNGILWYREQYFNNSLA